MTPDIIFEELFHKLKRPDFATGLGGEMPLFIQPVPPDRQMEAEEEVKRLTSRLIKSGKTTVMVNLFDLTIEILKEEQILDTLLEGESGISRADIVATLDSVLDIQAAILPRIKSLIETHHPDYLFLSGVGNVYPFIRSHGILNNIDMLTEEKCTLVLFFPGDYDGFQLKLFGHIWDENYYRGLNLNDIN